MSLDAREDKTHYCPNCEKDTKHMYVDNNETNHKICISCGANNGYIYIVEVGGNEDEVREI